ncbi:hypothetical protein PHMEG_0008127 [Phytophthora megakarya]|uniref:Uncharacterized protein n=1 Tax=Phytophthora megakarya TaxID=4795 RepID=A0A225WL80_9STRA|nr:hypothetical protein PHMEG_0008127 [Phytophthora megakarya]
MKLESYDLSYDQEMISGEDLSSPVLSNATYPGFASPNILVTFERRQNGTSFPLSKPILREDGLILVGTEILPTSQNDDKNRIFVTNFLTSGSHPPAHIMVEQEVRDISWINTQAAIVAIGNKLQVIQLGDLAVGGPCRMQDPINTVHADCIREIAVSPTRDSYVLSGVHNFNNNLGLTCVKSTGFDEKVMLTDLRNHGDPKASAIIGQYNANDVVSSVRWSPSGSRLSWTTDGGDFQFVDTRVHSSQLQVPLHTFLNVNTLGGVFTHEYLDDVNIVLGFERGHMALIDTRMVRQESCTSLIESKLTAVGEIRRSKSDKFAIFGHGGFSTASLNATTNGLVHINMHQQTHQTLSKYKSSGDFSFENGSYLAVSDNLH